MSHSYRQLIITPTTHLHINSVPTEVCCEVVLFRRNKIFPDGKRVWNFVKACVNVIQYVIFLEMEKYIIFQLLFFAYIPVIKIQSIVYT